MAHSIRGSMTALCGREMFPGNGFKIGLVAFLTLSSIVVDGKKEDAQARLCVDGNGPPGLCRDYVADEDTTTTSSTTSSSTLESQPDTSVSTNSATTTSPSTADSTVGVDFSFSSETTSFSATPYTTRSTSFSLPSSSATDPSESASSASSSFSMSGVTIASSMTIFSSLTSSLPSTDNIDVVSRVSHDVQATGDSSMPVVSSATPFLVESSDVLSSTAFNPEDVTMTVTPMEAVGSTFSGPVGPSETVLWMRAGSRSVQNTPTISAIFTDAVSTISRDSISATQSTPLSFHASAVDPTAISSVQSPTTTADSMSSSSRSSCPGRCLSSQWSVRDVAMLNPLWTGTSRTRLRCAAWCLAQCDCAALAYSSATRGCQLGAVTNSSADLVSAPGWVFYNVIINR